MKKDEIELKKLLIRSDNVKAVLHFLGQIARLATIAGCFYIMFAGLENIAKASPASLVALSQVLEKLNLSTVVAYLVAILTSAGWVYEYKGRKRLLKTSSARRKQLEANDPYNKSSGLTVTGDTPIEEEE